LPEQLSGQPPLRTSSTDTGKLVWLLPSGGSQLLVLDARRDAEHPLTAAKGTIVMRPEHYTQLCRGTNVRPSCCPSSS